MPLPYHCFLTDNAACCVHCNLLCMLCEDVLHLVNDGSVSWMRRVKLLRYAWVSEDVMLLNKKQILMNVLVNAVSDTRRYW